MRIFLIIIVAASCCNLQAEIDESQTGAWYMYNYKFAFDETRWGLQGDFQYRDWEGLGDREQLLLRSGITYNPEGTKWLLTFGYANVSSGPPGDSDSITSENRIYQEALFPQVVGGRFLFSHRFRYEERFIENQDFRTRYRYNLMLNIPLNNATLMEKTFYLAMYNELFLNGQTDIGSSKSVKWFDRNRLYFGLGYVLTPKTRVQFGWMNQATDGADKGQLQFSVFQNL